VGDIKPPAALFSSLKQPVHIGSIRIRAGRIAGRQTDICAGYLKIRVLAQTSRDLVSTGCNYMLLSCEKIRISGARYIKSLLQSKRRLRMQKSARKKDKNQQKKTSTEKPFHIHISRNYVKSPD
jgi:hypothetical protein